jgi:hypothetical protein
VRQLLNLDEDEAMTVLSDLQKRVCRKFGANFLECDQSSKIGTSRDFDPRHLPINGLRHPPEGDTTGWFIWSSEAFSDAPDFFVPLHAFHLHERCPEILKYLGLAPGWRFLVAPDYEDIWFDANLLQV